MIRLRHKILLHAFQVLDQAILAASFLAWYLIVPGSAGPRSARELLTRQFDGLEILIVVTLLVSWYVIFVSTVHYRANRFTTLRSQAIELGKANVLVTGVLLLVVVASGRRGLSNTQVLLFGLTSFAVGVSTRVVVRAMLMRLRRRGRNRRHILFIGTNSNAIALAERVANRLELGYSIEGFLTETTILDDRVGSGRWPVMGTVNDTRAVLETRVVDEVMVCLPLETHFLEIYYLIALCRERGVVVRVRPELCDVQMLSRSQVELFESDYIITFFREQLLGQLFVKRVVDVVLSATLLAVCALPMIVVAILIKLDSTGPIMFVQERIGMNKRRFRLLKFRSMVVDAERRRAALEELNEMDGPVFKIVNDPRITRIGRFIRRTSIDELPQLINVLKGEMSLVGPRPPLPSEVDQYDWINRKRISIMPGLTCLWQVSGRNNVSFREWMELDRKYIESWSLWLDLKILAKTVPVVLFGKGAR